MLTWFLKRDTKRTPFIQLPHFDTYRSKTENAEGKMKEEKGTTDELAKKEEGPRESGKPKRTTRKSKLGNESRKEN